MKIFRDKRGRMKLNKSDRKASWPQKIIITGHRCPATVNKTAFFKDMSNTGRECYALDVINSNCIDRVLYEILADTLAAELLGNHNPGERSNMAVEPS